MNPSLAPLAAALANPPPWLSPYVPLVAQILEIARSQSVAAALNAACDDRDIPVRFVEQSQLGAGEAYESFIARTAAVPTRDNLHDLFNGLMWLVYPATKQRMNMLQAQQIQLRGTSGPRGVLRDALTVFDENAALLHAPASLLESLREHDWPVLFLRNRTQWQSARLVVFGHALMEKLMQPRKAITAHVWVADDLSDVAVAASISPERLAARPFLPLPLLGVPGWWADNEEPSFYDDRGVFR